MIENELLQAGIAAVKAGDLSRARQLFAQVVKVDPASEQGWLGLAYSCVDHQQRIYCFRRLLAINPSNQTAQRELARLTAPARPVVKAPSTEITAEPPENAPARTPTLRQDAQTAHTREPVQKPVVEKPSRRKSQAKYSPAVFIALTGIGLILGIFSMIVIYFVSDRPSSQDLLSLAAVTNTPVPTAPVARDTLPPPTSAAKNTDKSTATESLTSAPTRTALPQKSPTVTPSEVIDPSPQTLELAFVKGSCSFNVPSGANVDCGFVSVPENRQDPSSRAIQLAVAVYHSTDPYPAREPVIYLAGGPGSGIVADSPKLYKSFILPLSKDRDVILFDQRGIGLSKPVLDCQELATVFVLDLMGSYSEDGRLEVYTDAVVACRDRLTHQGITLSAYNSKASAADVKDIITALGYPRTHIYGVSYGSLLAQVVLRDHPEIVRSVVLDSVVPLEAKLLNDSARNSQSALDTLFAGCAADADCQGTYPNLQADFLKLMAQLSADPITVDISLPTGNKVSQIVDGIGMANAVVNLVNVTSLIPAAPQLIYQIQSGDNAVLSYALALPVYTFSTINLGAYISINCHDEIFTTSAEELQTDIRDSPAAMAMEIGQMAGSLHNLFQICESWGAEPLVPGETDPVSSDIPALVVAGAYDPTTPPAYAQQVAQHLSNSYYYEIPNQGHGQMVYSLSDCPVVLMRSFLDNPDQEPDSSCLDKIEPVDFLIPYSGNPPIELTSFTNTDTGIKAEVPAGWDYPGDGFYNRYNSVLDVTQFGMQKSTVTIEEWIDWLENVFYGKKGFDQPPVKVGQRNANGMTWYLYKTSLDGHPVDIGFTRNDGVTMMILLYSYQNEHDALYQDVFLPALDSALIAQ